MCVSRFTSLAWGYVHAPDYPKGVLAAGYENGELAIYDPVKIIEGASIEEYVHLLSLNDTLNHTTCY